MEQHNSITHTIWLLQRTKQQNIISNIIGKILLVNDNNYLFHQLPEFCIIQ